MTTGSQISDRTTAMTAARTSWYVKEPPGESRRSSRKESMETGGGGDDVGGVTRCNNYHSFFHSSEYNHNFGGRTAGKTVGGKFQSWVLDKNLSGYLFTEHNPSLTTKTTHIETTQQQLKKLGITTQTASNTTCRPRPNNQQSAASNITQLKLANRPNDTDVLLGRGLGINRHPGNANFRATVSQHAVSTSPSHTTLCDALFISQRSSHSFMLNRARLHTWPLPRGKK